MYQDVFYKKIESNELRIATFSVFTKFCDDKSSIKALKF